MCEFPINPSKVCNDYMKCLLIDNTNIWLVLVLAIPAEVKRHHLLSLRVRI